MLAGLIELVLIEVDAYIAVLLWRKQGTLEQLTQSK
jgi:hypothetical protein